MAALGWLGMERVVVLGCAGAGKTTFSLELAARAGLPAIHLDRHYWQSGWRAPPRTQWERRVTRLRAAPRWVMDGNYGGTLAQRLARADTAIFLDLPRGLCLWRVLVRTLRHLGRTRADMRAGCPERFDLAFLRYIWHYPRLHRPRVLAQLTPFAQQGGTVVRLRSRAQVAAYLQGLGDARHAGS